MALLNPKTSVLTQKRHSCTRGLGSETSGDSKNAFLRYGDVFADQGTACGLILFVFFV